MRNRNRRRGVLLVVLAVLLAGLSSCKGKGGTTPNRSSNWDQMIWDTDVWA